MLPLPPRNPKIMKHTLLSVLISVLSFSVIAQDNSTAPAAKEKATEKKAKSEKTSVEESNGGEKVEGKSKVKKPKPPYRFMANVHGGIGLMNYFGDLRDKPGTTIHRIGSHPGYNFGIGANVTNYLEVNVNAMLAQMTWNQNVKLHDTPLNFDAKVFTVGANLVYNFKNLILDPTGITPFVSIGASYSDYTVRTDLQDANGNVYYYWSDNTIHNVSETSPATDDVRTLQRDYDYETPASKHPITAVAIPVGAGLDFNASRKFAVRLGAFYYFTSSDKLDNVTGGNKGFFSNDGFLYTSMSVFYRFDPFKKKAPKVDELGAEYGDIAALVEEDSDGDGVTDLNDRCEGTPKGLVVDEHGCPADEDGDGIPDYRDQELKTTPGRIVDENGVAISYQDIYQNYGSDTASLPRKNVDEKWLFSQKSIDPKYTVHVGTYTNYDIPTQIKLRLAKMDGLVEHKVNDSISVFTVGNFDNFEAAQQKQNELLESGIDEAFGVNEGALSNVGVDLEAVAAKIDNKESQPNATLNIESKDVLQYGVELREYRLRIELDKLSKLIAKYGVEMKTTEGGMKIYTIGSFKSYAEAQSLQREVSGLGVKNSEITAKFNNVPMNIDEAQQKEAEIQSEKTE